MMSNIARVSRLFTNDVESVKLKYVKYHFLIIDILLINSDINKFLWMVRIGGSTEKGEHIKENDYYTPSGEFR